MVAMDNFFQYDRRSHLGANRYDPTNEYGLDPAIHNSQPRIDNITKKD